MIVKIGTFHDVVATALGEAGLSILDKSGNEFIIRFNSYEGVLFVDGEFGSFDNAKDLTVLEGITPSQICAVTTQVRSICDGFHTRTLQLTNTFGLHFTWELFCEGEPETDLQAA